MGHKKKGGSRDTTQARLLVERETGFEPATSTLARLHSTAELFPLGCGRLVNKEGKESQGKNGETAFWHNV
jgi:hypothetical protein